ncbi:MAG: AsmA-like C-terminal region-containing protein, partial [Pseudorhodobacter sp.]
GKPLRLPTWALVEAESRINTAVQDITGEGAGLSVGGAVFVVDEDWIPRLRLEDVRLLESNGATFLSLPEVRVAIDPAAIAQGKVRLRSLRLIGANMNLRRLKDGRFDLALNLGVKPKPIVGLSGVISTLVALSEHPSLSHLRRVEAQALTLTVDDQMLGHRWEMGDGRLQLNNRADELAVELGVSVAGGQTQSGTASVTLIAAKSDSSARMTVSIDRIGAADLAAQAAPLAWLSVMDAPISGQIASSLDVEGALASLDASLTLDKGALRPTAETKPVPFDGASLFFGYDPLRERLDLREATVNSKDIALKASGHAYLPGVTSQIPQEVLAQIQIESLQLDPQGLLDKPVTFDQGALDFRVRLAPFGVDIGQATLSYQGENLRASGQVDAGPKGWSVAIDAALDKISRNRLLALWPPQVVPKTRLWVSENVQDGTLSNVNAGFRLAPDVAPLFSLGYDFSGADVRFLKTLPPIEKGRGYSVVEGKSYTMVLEEGFVTAKTGGAIDASGSVFKVADVTEKPAQAEITLKAKGGLTAALSILDEEPFEFMTKAKLPVDLGQGQADIEATIHTPLRKGVKIKDVAYVVAGKVMGFTSDKLVPGRSLRADRLNLHVTPQGMEVSGSGSLQSVPFDGRFTKQFGPAFKGISQVTAKAELSPKAAANLGVDLPPGLISGRGTVSVTLDLRQGERPQLALASDLSGLAMSIPALAWSKAARSKGNLALDITLGKPAIVNSFTLDAAGLRATGTISLSANGGMEVARLSSVKLGTWLDASATLTGRGNGRSPAVSVTGGKVDLRGLPARNGAANGAGGPITLALDQLTVSNGLALTGFRSTITPGVSGVLGDFSGRVNGQAPVKGNLIPTAKGTAVRLLSDDAGAVLSAAKLFPNADGGALDLTLTPTGAIGTFDGKLKVNNVRIRKAPALAELINAISVVGLLDQMNGTGLLFNEADATFRLSPRAVQIAQGSAVGASLGVSMSGLYVFGSGRLDLQGVVSPIYLLNGIGAIFTRRGEGLFGFNYKIKGTAKEPNVSVNPLSFFTPGMFREIFRSPPPKLEPSE